jgi:hypothetical protein
VVEVDYRRRIDANPLDGEAFLESGSRWVVNRPGGV